MTDFYETIGGLTWVLNFDKTKEVVPVKKPSRDTRKIAFNIADFLEFIETMGCDCCYEGHKYIKDGNLMNDWESNIQYVITKHTDVLLEGEIIE